MLFGSHVYGTSLPTSDRDYKEVFVPDGEDILLGRATKVSRNNSTKAVKTDRNTADDVDVESFAYAGFLRLLAEGQTIVTDMLFVPPEHITHSTHPWHEIVYNRDLLISKRISGFVGYCKAQANKYGIKGSRVNAAQAIVEWLEMMVPHACLSDYEEDLRAFCEGREHAEMIDINGLPHLSVCNRKQSMTVKVKYALAQYRELWDKYGARARQAAANEGIDWKALMHAVRIGHQAHELLATGRITFPRPEAALLLQIRQGELPYALVAEMIEGLLETLEQQQDWSTLREKPDQDFIDNLILRQYRGAVSCS